jgi:hypothetical protein
MALKEHPNEWEGFPKEQVVDWLDNPCTSFLRSQIAKGMAEYDQLCVDLITSQYRFSDEDMRNKSDQIRVGKLALSQALALIGKAEEYVKA